MGRKLDKITKESIRYPNLGERGIWGERRGICKEKIRHWKRKRHRIDRGKGTVYIEEEAQYRKQCKLETISQRNEDFFRVKLRNNVTSQRRKKSSLFNWKEKAQCG